MVEEDIKRDIEYSISFDSMFPDVAREYSQINVVSFDDMVTMHYNECKHIEGDYSECPRCHKKTFVLKAIQTRSSDEAADTFFNCSSCGYKGKL